MSEKQFETVEQYENLFVIRKGNQTYNLLKACDLLNEQQEYIEELQVSEEMGWKRAERFEKKCPKELHNKKMYIKRLEYKVQKFKQENKQLQEELKKQKLLNESLGLFMNDE